MRKTRAKEIWRAFSYSIPSISQQIKFKTQGNPKISTDTKVRTSLEQQKKLKMLQLEFQNVIHTLQSRILMQLLWTLEEMDQDW